MLVGGRLVVENGRCLTVDEHTVRYALAEQREKRRRAPSAETLEAMRKLAALRRLVLA